MTQRVLVTLTLLLLAASAFGQELPQCVAQFGQVTTTINGVQIRTPGNNGITEACVNCCDDIVVTAPVGALVNIKWAAAWTYTGATAGANYCSAAGPLFYYMPAVLPWLQHVADRDMYDEDEVIRTSAGTPITVRICHPAGDWKSPEIHIDFLVNVTSAAGAPLVTNFSGTGGWDPHCVEKGCTPGFWKNHYPEAWPVANLNFATVFGVTPTGTCPPRTNLSTALTFLQGLDLGGGGQCALIRHATSAYLNSLAPGLAQCGQQPFPELGFPYTTAQVIQMVRSAYKSGDFDNYKNLLAAANESMCTGAAWGGANSCTPDSFCDYWLSKGVPLF